MPGLASPCTSSLIACEFTQAKLTQAAGATQRSYENDDGVPVASIVTVLATALHVSTDELLGWKTPGQDQRAVIRLINSLATVKAPRSKNGAMEGRNGHTQ